MLKRDVGKILENAKIEIEKKKQNLASKHSVHQDGSTLCAKTFFRSVELKRLIESSQLPSGTGCLYMQLC